MFKKICKLCWKEYKGRLSSKYCSWKCRREIVRIYNKWYYDKNKDKRKEMYSSVKIDRKIKKKEKESQEIKSDFLDKL